jgi:hypothetical protein
MPSDAHCDVRRSTLFAAISEANVDGLDSRIKLGPGDYADGPYLIDGSTSSLEVVGNNNGTGNQATTIIASGATPYVTVDSATLRNLRIQVNNGGTGLLVRDGASAQSVVVADTTGAPASNATGISAEGSSVLDSTVNLFRGTGNVGYLQTGSGVATVARDTFRVTGTGVAAQAGTLSIENSLFDLGGAAATGLRAGTAGSTGTVTVNARQLTVVGGIAGSQGVLASGPAASVTTTVSLANSIVRGPVDSLVAATSSGGAATLNVHHSDFQSKVQNGTGTITETGGGNVDLDPSFLNPAADDYALRAGSPVVDKGDVGTTSGPDRAGNVRVVNGIPDMGAYELQPAPKTTFTAGPTGLTNNRQPVFQFKSDTAKTFECQVDSGPWHAGCKSPATTTALADGAHTFSVRATDAAFSVENPPVTRSFTVDATVPNATITKKPPKRFFKKRVKFKFAVSERGAKLQCNLDNRGWRTCQTTYRFNVKVGKHRIQVRAVDAAGNIDPTPAHYTYRRVKRHR